MPSGDSLLCVHHQRKHHQTLFTREDVRSPWPYGRDTGQAFSIVGRVCVGKQEGPHVKMRILGADSTQRCCTLPRRQTTSGNHFKVMTEKRITFIGHVMYLTGFPGGASGNNLSASRRYKKCGFDPWVGKISWRRAWQPTLVFLPREAHGQRSLVGCSLWGHRHD